MPDVSASANPGLLTALVSGGRTAIYPGEGTSASTPLWAGIIAPADQYAGHPLGFINPALYRIGTSPQYHAAFNDITVGGNTTRCRWGFMTFRGYRARRRWDPITGWGTPHAAVLVELLAQDDPPHASRPRRM